MSPARWIAAMSLVIGLGSLVGVAQAGTPTTVQELVTEVQSTYQSVQSVRANFVQTLHNPITGKDERKSGRIAMERPRKVRIEVGTPVESAVVSDGSTLWIYAAAQKQVIVQKEAQGAGGLGALIDDLGQLGNIFTVTMQPDTTPPKPTHTVTLVPKQSGQQYKSLTLTLSKQKYQIQQLVLVDQMDTKTTMDFTGVIMNMDVPDSTFTFKAPTGTQVIDAGSM